MNSILSQLLADAESGFWMPEQASDYARHVDSTFGFILWLSAFMFVVLTAVMLYFVVKYRRRSADQRTSPLKDSLRLQVLWTGIPMVLMVIMFVWGFSDYSALSVTPRDSLQVRVTAKQWSWAVSYPGLDRDCLAEQAEDGSQQTTFYVPVDKPFTMLLSSEDTIHSLWIPAFRVKQDALPNRYTGFTITPTKTGSFPVYTAELSGTDYSRMGGTVEVLSAQDWADFLTSDICKDDPTAPGYGEKLFVKLGCAACHDVSADQKRVVGPPLFGVDTRTEDTSAGPIVVDDGYLRESILEPQAKIVKSYESATMPSFSGRVNDAQLDALIKYVKGLDDAPSAGADGQAPEQPATPNETE